jgi:glycosyltransferase involved in cell wall biosynthesis
MNDMSKHGKVLVSVIVPVFNVEPYLKRCVDSVRDNTYRNIEIILVDDGSPDRCPEICDEYAKLDARVKVIHQDNKGSAMARNAGIDTSAGEWLCFVDSDDFVDVRFVEVLLEAANEHKAIAARCKRKLTFKSVADAIDSAKESKAFDWFGYLAYVDNTAGPEYTIHSACCGIYHKSLFENLRFPEYKHTEDSPVNAQILWNNRDKKFAVTNQTLYYYFQSAQSTTRGKTSLKALERYTALEWLLDYWDANGEAEAYRCYFKDYFTKLVNDYTEMCRDLPGQARQYRHLKEKIDANADKAKEMNLKVAVIPPYSQTQLAELRGFDGNIVLYGYNNRSYELMPWLEYLKIKVSEVWDNDADDFDVAGVVVNAPHSRYKDKRKVKIIVALDGEEAQLRVRRGLRQLGYDDFVSCDNAFGAVKYAKYNKFLPIMHDGFATN